MRLLHRDQHNEAGDHDSDRDVGGDDPDHLDGDPGHRDGDTIVDRRDGDVVTTGDTRSTAAVRREPTTIHERTWTFAPGQLISFIVGVGLIIVGLVAMLRAGIDGSFGTPTVEVLDYSHTAWLGLAEVGTGLLLVLAGSGAWGRPLSVLIGAAMVVAGVLVVAETDQMPEELGLEDRFGWPIIALGGLVAVAAMTLPVWRRRAIKEGDIVDPRERDDLRAEDAKHAHF
jgi:hypothetical protein